jgi:hypothetical protein
VEGTSGAVEFVTFREETEETALNGKASESSPSQTSWFERGRNRTAAEQFLFQVLFGTSP